MFEVGFSEIILILGLALLVLGPERLPDLAAKVGRWTGRARAMARQFQAQLEQEVNLENATRQARESQSTPHYPNTAALGSAPDSPTIQPSPAHAEQESAPADEKPAVDAAQPKP